VYVYILLVTGIIFGLSFGVEGDKISAAVVFDVTKDYVSSFDILSVSFMLFFFLSLLAVSLFFIRHAHERKKGIHPSHLKLINALTIFIILISFFSFVNYFGKSEGKIVGAAIQEINLDVKDISSNYVNLSKIMERINKNKEE
jgi:glucan phosphoethanolaminetransferase (alkaline phosphatase superfamily)